MTPRWFQRGVLAASVLACLAGGGLLAGHAHATFEAVTETGAPGYLKLRSKPGTPHWEDFGPGHLAYWQIEARLVDAARGRFHIEVQAEGSLVGEGLLAEVTSCSTAFTGSTPTCRGAEHVIFPRAPIAEFASPAASTLPERVVTLPDIHVGEPRFFLLRLERPEQGGPPKPTSARIGVGFHAHGHPVPEDDPLPFPVTGVEALAVGLLAAGMVGAGVIAAGTAGRRGGTSAAPGGQNA